MLKFVVLGLLALGCYAEELKENKLTFGTTGGFGHDGKLIETGVHGVNNVGDYRVLGDRYVFDGVRYGHGYGSGLGHIGYGTTGLGHIGYGTTGLGFGRVGYGTTGLGHLGGVNRLHYGYGNFHGLGGGFGGLYGVVPSYQYVKPVTTGFVQQPVVQTATTGFVHQPVVQTATTGFVHQPLVQTGVVDKTVRVGSVVPAVNFLTAHKSDVHQDVVQAAVQQLGRTVEYKSMGHQEHPITPQVVEVESSESPLHLHFKTKSSSISLSQSHEQAPVPEVQVTQSQEEPARLVHEIQKPIIQEVRELITPYRQVTQEISPVVEAVHTVVTKAEGQRQNYVAPSTYSVGRTEGVVAPITTVAHQQIGAVAAQPIVSTIAQPAHVGYQQIVAQPFVSTFEAKPVVSTFEAKPVVSTFETKPIVSKFETKPIVSTFETKPIVPKFETKPLVSTFETKPIVSKFETKPLVSTFETKPVVSKFDEKIVAGQAIGHFGQITPIAQTIVGTLEPKKVGFGQTQFTESKIVPSTTTGFGGLRFGGDINTFRTGFENRLGVENRVGGTGLGVGDRFGVVGTERVEKQEIRKSTF